MFIFKGISTKDMRIIVEEPENLIAKAPLKHEVLNIEGRDDAIYHPLGYAPVEIPLTLQLLDPSKIDQVLMWLNGEGELIYKDRKTKARIFSEIQPIRTAGIRIINIEIIRAPFWYGLEDDYSEAWGANLIPNGWGSFEPYGSGINYVNNWNFESDTLIWYGVNATRKIEDQKLIIEATGGDPGATRVEGLFNVDSKENIIRVKARGATAIQFRQFVNAESIREEFPFESENEWTVVEVPFTVIDESKEVRVRIYVVDGTAGTKMEIDWVQISPIDKQHLVVEKTKINDHLTRIQTWGGTVPTKLLTHLDTTERITFSALFKNLGNRMQLLQNKGWVTEYLNEGEKSYKYLSSNPTASGANQVHIRGVGGKDLDFIVSNPIIVEGNKPAFWEADENPRIINEGTAPSKPLIKLSKVTSSICEFEVNGVYFKYHFNHDTEVLIDCEKMEASDNGHLRNRHLTIGYEFPVLDPGPNVVKRISGDAKIEFKRKDRWL